MKRDWMNIGHEYTDKQRPRLAEVFDGLDWQAIADMDSLPMMAGMALEAALTHLPMPRLSHVAVSHELAPCGLIAARCNYTNGQADIYLLDTGSGCTPLAADFYPKDELDGFRLAVWQMRKHYGRPKMEHGIVQRVA